MRRHPIVAIALLACSTSAVADASRDARSIEHRWRSAIANDDTPALAAMIVDHDGRDLTQRVAGNGKSALMVAAKSDDLSLVQALVRRGADIHRRTASGGTAMMFAALGRQPDTARWLLAQGASLDDTGSNGWTALTIAAARGLEPMVDWLLVAGAAPAPVDVYGFTPLMRSVENGHTAATARLLAADGIAIDHADESGNTALHHAASAGRRDLVALLLHAGANAALTNRLGAAPAELVVNDPDLSARIAATVAGAPRDAERADPD